MSEFVDYTGHELTRIYKLRLNIIFK